ncbi:MAG: hypothetical protein LBQ37_02355 [Elusimicrobiota bacterium]|jgi:hypothetical protein|nr:hypothetical protein [Elusimicrobiota bacterium]
MNDNKKIESLIKAGEVLGLSFSKIEKERYLKGEDPDILSYKVSAALIANMNETERKTQHISFRITPKERIIIENLARNKSKKPADYLRDIIIPIITAQQ